MKRTKRRGRKSFENSYKQRRKVYNRYVRMAKKKKEKLGDNIRIMEYSDFKANYTEYRRRMNLAKTGEIEVSPDSVKNPTLSNFIEETVLVTRSQATSASDNYNAHIDAALEKLNSNGGDVTKLTDWEKELIIDYQTNGYMKQIDVRGKTDRYLEMYNIASYYGMGSEAFGT